MIRIEHIWLGADPADMCSGIDRLLTQVVAVFGQAQPYHTYVFANSSATRLKVVVHDGFGVWMAIRRLHVGTFVWPRQGEHWRLTPEQAH